NCLYGTFAWTPEQLLSSILQFFCQMTGKPYPAPVVQQTAVTAPPVSVPVGSPIGAAVGNGYLDNLNTKVYTTPGQTYTAGDGTVYVLVSINSIFGPNNYWTVKTAAPAAA
ncbi:MAG: hypothetical protein ACLQVN_17930, partial [Bryobacteraceae bacterium]